MKDRIKLGDRVRDNISGFEGIAMGRAIYFNGCVRIQIEATELHEGKRIDAEWIDESQVSVVKSEVMASPNNSTDISGGPQSDPIISRTKP